MTSLLDHSPAAIHTEEQLKETPADASVEQSGPLAVSSEDAPVVIVCTLGASIAGSI